MRLKEKTDNWLEIQDYVKEDFISLLSHDELVFLADALKLKVPGFSKRLKNAPLPLLKNTFEAKLNKINPMRKFIENYCKPYSEQLEEVSYNEGLIKIGTNNNLTKSKIIALISIFYSDKYMKLRDSFNRDLNQHLLSDIVELELEDLLVALVDMYSEYSEESFEVLQLSSEKIDLNSLNDYFTKEYKLTNEYATKVFLTQNSEQKMFSESEIIALSKVSIYELIERVTAEAKEKLKLQEERKERDKENKRLLDKNAVQKNIYEDQLDSLKKDISAMETENNRLGLEITSNIEAFEKDLNDLKEQFEDERKINSPVLCHSDKILLFSSRLENYRGVVDDELLLESSEIDKYLNNPTVDAKMFIDAHSLSTSKKMKITNKAKRNKHRVSIINGPVKKIIRDIIYNLEGER